MKIGILTYHRTHNYGGCLQALATRLVLEGMGHEVYYVDYWPDYHRNEYKLFKIALLHKRNFKGKCKYFLDFMFYLPWQLLRRASFHRFHDSKIIPFCNNIGENYDAVIYGSDQIWRKQSTGKYNPVYFGCNDIPAKFHIAFSASAGLLPKNNEDAEKFMTLVSKMDKISVRETELKDYLEKHGLNPIAKTLDPTLLLSSNDWDKQLEIKEKVNKKYILLYLLRGGFKEDTVRNYAKVRGLDIKVLTYDAMNLPIKGRENHIGPEGFVELIKNAELVITSSFHGLAFSIIYRKEVFASFSENGGRGFSLLDSLGLKDRYLEPFSKIPESYAPIDYDIVQNKLVSMKRESLKYLKESLNFDHE